MTQTYSNELAVTQTTTPDVPSATAGYGARLHRYRATITLASQASGDTIVLANIPAGNSFAFGVVTASASLSTSTFAIGNSTTAGKYRADAVSTAVNAPALFGLAAAASGVQSAAGEQVLLTAGTATFPSSGTLVIDLYFSGP